MFISRSSWSIVAVAVVAGIIGGAAAGSVMWRYTWERFIDEAVDDLAGDAGQQLVIQPRNVVVEHTDRVQAVAQEMRTHMVSLYPAQSAYRSSWTQAMGTTTEPFFAYHPSELVGEALVVTNDGWLVTTAAAAKAEQLVAVDQRGRSYRITTAVTDPVTGVRFLRAAEADWSAAPFAGADTVIAGATLVEIFGAQVASALVQEEVSGPVVRSSEQLYGILKLEKAFVPGAVAVRLNGEVAGLENGEGRVIPIQHITSALPALLGGEPFNRPRLGVHYLSLSEAVTATPLAGALVSASASGSAVVSGSPAERAGLAAGDVITVFGGDAINDSRSLSLAVQNRRVGEQVSLTVRRNGTERELTVTLDALPLR